MSKLSKLSGLSELSELSVQIVEIIKKALNSIIITKLNCISLYIQYTKQIAGDGMAVVESLTTFDVLVVVGVIGAVIGLAAKAEISKLIFGNQIKHEIKSELLDKEQTKQLVENKEQIQQLRREIDQLKSSK